MNRVPACLEAGRVHLCREAANTVLSRMAGDAPLLSDGFPMKSYNAIYNL